jgi:ribonucleoside-diphosphate reductase alpha chain
MDWTPVRESVKKYGMRNSNTMAIAPTATISNITGSTQSIEPMYKHLFVKSNLSGEFTIPNIYLVEHLKKLGLWDKEMLDDLKYFDGSIP